MLGSSKSNSDKKDKPKNPCKVKLETARRLKYKLKENKKFQIPLILMAPISPASFKQLAPSKSSL